MITMTTHMKLLSIIVPSFNSEKFLESCLDSLLLGIDDEIEVIVVNDGSTDKTSEIAHRYADKHSFIKVLDKENGGHGSGINRGLELATGLYFKVLDSDDHLDKDGLFHLLDKIKEHQKEDSLPDLYVTDYYSVSVETGDKTLSSLAKRFPKDEPIIPFEQVKQFATSEYFMMHMLFAKTSMLRETHLQVVEKTFYEDNQFVIDVIKCANTIVYLDKFIYRYVVGRDGQSISIASADKNYSHQLRVYKAVIDELDMDEYLKMDEGRLYHFRHMVFILSTLTFFYIYIVPRKEKAKAYKEFIKYYKATKPKLYSDIKSKTPGYIYAICPPFLRGLATKLGYHREARKGGWK